MKEVFPQVFKVTEHVEMLLNKLNKSMVFIKDAVEAFERARQRSSDDSSDDEDVDVDVIVISN